MLHLDDRMAHLAASWSGATWAVAHVVIVTVWALQREREIEAVPIKELHCALPLSAHIVRAAIRAATRSGMLVRADNRAVTLGEDVQISLSDDDIIRRFRRNEQRRITAMKRSMKVNGAA